MGKRMRRVRSHVRRLHKAKRATKVKSHVRRVKGDNRPSHAIDVDGGMRARKAPDLKTWRKHKNRYDWYGKI